MKNREADEKKKTVTFNELSYDRIEANHTRWIAHVLESTEACSFVLICAEKLLIMIIPII